LIVSNGWHLRYFVGWWVDRIVVLTLEIERKRVVERMIENKRKKIDERDMVRTWTGGNRTLLRGRSAKTKQGCDPRTSH